MGKIVKFCSSCDEGFAEKFGFCPNCGQTLQSFEMNPVVAEAPPVEEAVIAAPADTEVIEPAEPAETYKTFVEPVQEAAAAFETVESVEEPVIKEPVIEEPVIETAAPKAAVAAPTFAFTQTKPIDVDRKPKSFKTGQTANVADNVFHATIIENRKFSQRIGGLFMAFAAVQILFLSAGLVYNIFSKDLEVGSIDDDIFNAVIVDDIPMIVEEEKLQNKDKGGGGGGGGRDEEEETTQGDLADQSKNPTRPPDAKVFRSDNFELKMPPPQTEGNQTYEKKYDRWGDPNGRFANFSNGTGTGGGQGSGNGTGQGSGRGTGNGSGDGSGSGSGIGNGNGNGTGDGDGFKPPPPKVVGVTQGVKIISKPKPGYTDSARVANIQGTVMLRVVFLASGQIGSISPVKSLPNGLTEQAIASARRISFEPAKNNGIPQTVTKMVEYSFSIY